MKSSGTLCREVQLPKHLEPDMRNTDETLIMGVNKRSIRG